MQIVLFANEYPADATCISRVRFLKKFLMVWPWIFLFTLILSDVMGAISMLFAPLCVRWIYSKLFMVLPYFKEEKLRLVFYLHVKDKLNLTSLINADYWQSLWIVALGSIQVRASENQFVVERFTARGFTVIWQPRKSPPIRRLVKWCFQVHR